jgi:DNA-binding MarR family transcriptional regulator
LIRMTAASNRSQSGGVDAIRLNRLARRLREIALKASQGGAEVPLSVGELAVFEAVARTPDSTISEISRATGLAQSWVSTIVRDLSQQRVVQQTKAAEDRRQTRVRLDPEVHRLSFEDYGARPIDGAVIEVAPHLDASGVQRVTELLLELDQLLAGSPASGTSAGSA